MLNGISNQNDKDKFICDICGKAITGDDFEYVLTQRGTELRMHVECIQKRMGSGSKRVAGGYRDNGSRGKY